MSSQNLNEYRPDTVTPPGFYVQEKLAEIGMTQTELGDRIGRTKKTVNEIVSGKAPIEPETALQLERVLGIPARFWNNAERQYRDHLVRQSERKRLADQLERLKNFPVSFMRRLGWLPDRADKIDCLLDLLGFFGVASFEALDQIDLQTCAAFRQSAIHRVERGAILSWLRKGELDARAITCKPFQRNKFQTTLSELRLLTLRAFDDGIQEAVRLCAEAGVALVFVPELPGTRTWGATRWLTPDKALMQLSARGKTDDQLWFTFFHEAGHVLLHPKKDIFIELDDTIDSREEEANRFAADLLIPPGMWSLLRQMKPRSTFEIQQFAEHYRVSASVLVGRMQREKLILPSHLNGFKTRIELRSGDGSVAIPRAIAPQK